MNLRPQGPEIIRTWLFDTVVRAARARRAAVDRHHDQRLGARPRSQEDVEVEGQRRHADAARRGVRRRRAALLGVQRPARRRHRGRLRRDEGRAQARDQGAQRVEVRARVSGRRGRRRAARCVTTALDRSLLVTLADLVDEATAAFDGFDYARSLERTERFFWSFCDDYVELVKSRAYGDAGDAAARSAAVTLRIALSTLLRLFAPVLAVRQRRGVVVVARGLDPPRRVARSRLDGCALDGGDPLVYEVAADVLAEVRKVKSTQKVSLRHAGRPGARGRHRRAARRARRRPHRRVRRGQDRQARDRGPAAALPVRVELANRSTAVVSNPAGFDAPSWLSSHVNLESLNVPAGSRRGAAHARADLHADAVPRFARDRVPGHPRHRHERQDHDRRACSPSCSTALGLKVGAYTSPHLEHVERAHVDRRRADRRRRVRGDALRGVARRGVGRRRPVVLRHRHRGRVPLVRRRSRRRRGRRGRHGRHVGRDERRRRPTSRSSPTSPSTTSSTSARRASRSRTEKAGIVKPGATLVLGETDPDLRRSSSAAPTGACSAATSTSASRATCSRSAVGSSTCAARARSTPTCSCRCTARTRPTTPRSRWPRPRASWARRFRSTSSPTRSRACSRPAGSRSSAASRSCCSTARTTSPARRRCARALDEELSAGPRTLVVGMLREKEPHEMLAALGVDELEGLLVCCRPPTPRALEPSFIAKAAVDLGVPEERIEVVDTGRGRGEHRAPRDAARRADRDHGLAVRRRRGPLRARFLTSQVVRARFGRVRASP